MYYGTSIRTKGSYKPIVLQHEVSAFQNEEGLWKAQTISAPLGTAVEIYSLPGEYETREEALEAATQSACWNGWNFEREEAQKKAEALELSENPEKLLAETENP